MYVRVGVAQHVPGRTAKQCRERWYLCVDPTIRRDPWTQEEDELLVSLHKEFGNGWALISQQLPGRTENSVKSRYKSLERKVEKMALKQTQQQAQQTQAQAPAEQQQGFSAVDDNAAKKKAAKRMKKMSSSLPVVAAPAEEPGYGQTPQQLQLHGVLTASAPALDDDRKDVVRHISSGEMHALQDFRTTNSFDNWMRENRDSGKLSFDDVVLSAPDASFDDIFGSHGDFDLV